MKIRTWGGRCRRVLSLSMVVLCLAATATWAALLGHREVLSNGMVLLVSEKRAVPIVTATMLIRAGATLDPPDKNGVANLAATLLTRGTATRTATQISEAIEFVGGSLSAEAGRDIAEVSLAVRSKDLDLGLDLLADILLNPVFAPGEVQRTIQEVVAGIKRKQDDPGEVSWDAFAALLFPGHPYGRPVEGTELSVPSITRDDLARFHEAYYRPEQTILAVVGDVSLPDLKQRLEMRLGPWKPGEVRIGAPAIPKPLERTVVRTIQRNVTQANISLGHHGVTRQNPDYYAIQVMNYILGGGGITSRLTAKIREEKGWAYDVGSYFSPYREAGTFAVSLQTKNEVAREAIDAVLAEIRRIREQPVSDGELEDAKAYLTGSFPLRLDTSSKIVRMLASIEYYGLGLDYVDRYPGLIGAVTVADIQRVAQQYLNPERYAMAVVADLSKANLKE